MKPPEAISELNTGLQGRYTIERELGEGGMATVYLATDKKHGRQVALKVLGQEFADALGPARFEREIRIVAGLRHPHILPLFDSGEADGRLFFVMPVVAGGTLRDRLVAEGQLPIEDVLRFGRELANALQHAHEVGIIHRDVKPENVMLDGGHALLSDFGIARATDASSAPELTRVGQSIGTPKYMSPEQAAGDEEVGARSDVYSLAVVLYEALAGDPPFLGSTPQALLARKLMEVPSSLRILRPTIPQSVELVLQKALAPAAADRFATPIALAEALQRAVDTPDDTIRRVAVLPFEDRSRAGSDAYLADGMADALNLALSRVGALQVLSTASTRRYRASTASLPAIAAELGVDALVSGSVLAEGELVRTTVAITQAVPERTIWSEAYDRPSGSVLALTSEVAREVAGKFRIRLSAEELSVLSGKRRADPEAERATLRGLSQMASGMGEPTFRALQFFEEAVQHDAEHAPAWAGIAHANVMLTYIAEATAGEAFEKAKSAARRAIEIDPNLADAHGALAFPLATHDWDWEGAEAAFLRALELNPGDTFAAPMYGFFLSWIGRFDEAIAQSRIAESYDLASPVAIQNTAMVLSLADRNEESVAKCRELLDMDPNSMWGYCRLGQALLGLGDLDGAIEANERAAELNPDSRRKGNLGHSYGRAGRESDARAVLDGLYEARSEHYVAPTALAAVHLGMGEADEAMALLERGYEERDGDMVLLSTLLLWDSLRDRADFQALLGRMRFPNATVATG